MQRPKAPRILRLAVLTAGGLSILALPASAGCASSKSCTLLGCESGAALRRPIAVTDAEAAALVITVCRNAACSTGASSREPRTPYSLPFTFAGSVPTYGYVLQTADGGHEVELHVGNTESELKNLNDGDVYTVRITRPGATAPLLEVTSKVVYKSAEPNGPGCGPTCKSASI